MTSLNEIPTVCVEDLPFADDRSLAWKELREAGEIVNAHGEVILTSADAVEFAAKNPEKFSSARALDRLASPVPLIPVAIDPPDHARFRKVLDPFFSPKRMAEREHELRRQAGELVDAIVARGRCEVIKDLATPFPSQVFLTLFGLPLADRDKLLAWMHAILKLANPGNAEPAQEALGLALELFTYLTQHIAERRENPQDSSDLLTQLIQDGNLTNDEILGLSFFFVIAGLDTVTSTAGFAFNKLATDAELRHRISNDHTLIPAFIEELLRVDGPIPFIARVTTEDVDVAGTVVPKDTMVMLSVGAANHDPRRFSDDNDSTDANEIRLNERGAHFAFGRGPHRCLGSHLARLELRVLLEEWHKRIPEYSLAPGAKPKVLWPRGTLGLDAVPLTVERFRTA